jgi:hypothetical protein
MGNRKVHLRREVINLKVGLYYGLNVFPHSLPNSCVKASIPNVTAYGDGTLGGSYVSSVDEGISSLIREVISF